MRIVLFTYRLSLFSIIVRRIKDDWKLLSSVFIGIMIATTVAAATPVYLGALSQLSFEASLDRITSSILNGDVVAFDIPLSDKSIQSAEELLDSAINKHLSPIYLGRETYIKGPTSVIGTSEYPMPRGDGQGIIVSRGYFQYLSRLEEHSEFIDGRMSGDNIRFISTGPSIEAVISVPTSQKFGINVGDQVTVSKRFLADEVTTVDIVGVLVPSNADDEYWIHAPLILDPDPLPVSSSSSSSLLSVDPIESPIPLFITNGASLILDEWDFSVQIGEDIYLSSAVFLVGHSKNPLPASRDGGIRAPLGYLHNLSNLGRHAIFQDGRMAGSNISNGPNGPEIEAVLASKAAVAWNIEVGDVLTYAPNFASETVLSVLVTGIFDQGDTVSEYWSRAGVFLNPPPILPAFLEDIQDEVGDDTYMLELENISQAYLSSKLNIPLLVNPNPNKPPIPLFVTKEAMIGAVLQAYPGTLIRPTWAILIDKDKLKNWSAAEARSNIRDFEQEITENIPGSVVSFSSIEGLTDTAESRIFYSKIPFLLILVVMVVISLIFLTMMVSYLVQTRQNDAFLLRTRGVSIFQLIRLYSVEAFSMSFIAILLAPCLAILLVALIGLLPFFGDINHGSLLPVRIDYSPFVVAAVVGLISVFIFVIPSILATRTSVIEYGLRASRPSIFPFFQRYYLDLALLFLGGLIFWELYERGQLISGGLFTELKINETLLLLPVIFLIVVALIFMRLFPLLVRFISAESPTLMHIFVSVVITFTMVRLFFGDGEDHLKFEHILKILLISGVGICYWTTNRFERRNTKIVGMFLQVLLVSTLLILVSPEYTFNREFLSYLGLLSIVPIQLVYIFLKRLMNVSPVWMVIGLWRMSRDPFQYTWLILLLVLVTGLAILSTTVGGTLERSERDTINYNIPTDVRVGEIFEITLDDVYAFKQKFSDVSGVNSILTGLRGNGMLGTKSASFLAVETNNFANISWYRPDFSDASLDDLMTNLNSSNSIEKLPLPAGINTIGAWVKPLEFNPFLDLYVILKDSSEELTPVYLGRMDSPDWKLMENQIDTDLDSPMYLVSFVIFESGADGFSFEGTSGTIFVDNIQVRQPISGAEYVLEDFESDSSSWMPIITSGVSIDNVEIVTDHKYSGSQAAKFSFGNQTRVGFRGFYFWGNNPDVGLPIVIDSSLSQTLDIQAGEILRANIDGYWIPVVVRDTIDFFPTLNPDKRGFMIADLETLLAHTNVLIDYHKFKPNEIFVDHEFGLHDLVVSEMQNILQTTGKLYESTQRLENLRLDPYSNAGWKPMVLLSTVISILAAGVGYSTYLLLFSKRSRYEMASIKSLGLSNSQLVGLLGFEHLAIASIGLGIGTWAGFQMSRLMVQPIAVTDMGRPVIPPFILTTEWTVMLTTYGLLSLIFVGAVFVLIRGLFKLDLQGVSRRG